MRQGDTLRTENQEFCTTYNMLKVILFLSSFWSYRVGRHPCRNLGYHAPGSSLSTTIDQFVAFWTDKRILEIFNVPWMVGCRLPEICSDGRKQCHMQTIMRGWYWMELWGCSVVNRQEWWYICFHWAQEHQRQKVSMDGVPNLTHSGAVMDQVTLQFLLYSHFSCLLSFVLLQFQPLNIWKWVTLELTCVDL